MQGQSFAGVLGCAAKRGLIALALIVVSGLACGADDAPAQAPNRAPMLSVDQLSVVKVKAQAVRGARTLETLGPERHGTGVVIDTNGLVLTIGYLITEAETVELSLADGKSYPATVIGYDSTTGMGLLKALAPLPIRPVDLGESGTVAERELVLIVGFDGVAPAYVVSKRPFVGYWEYVLDEAIYTAPATVNWQGAALLSREGKLIGIGSLAVGDAMGSRASVPGNMFVPIDTMKPVLADLIANGRSTAQPRPWLGINTQEVQGNLIVTRVSPESPADEAGIQKGDIILGVGGKEVKGQRDFYTKLWATGQAGVEVPIEALHGNRVQKFSVKSIDRDRYYRPKPVY